MYEHQTFNHIMKRMLEAVPQDVDQREGSIIYDALAPAAIELAEMYAQLDLHLNLSFADTSSGEYLERRIAEFGVYRKQATHARRLGIFYGKNDELLEVPIGTRYSIKEATYTVIERLAKGRYILESKLSGTVGNTPFGTLLPIDYVEGLVRAELGEVLVPGEDTESDRSLRERYLAAINEQPYGGNSSDYRQKINGIAGVGSVKVFPVWQGGGTVKVTLLTSDYSSPSQEFIEQVQTMVDPELNSGEGLGFAPIGHRVTVTGAESMPIQVETTVILGQDITLGQVQPDIENVIADYMYSLRQTWMDETAIVVRLAQIESRILTVAGVVDVVDTQLNGAAGNVQLTEEQVPILGAVILHE